MVTWKCSRNIVTKGLSDTRLLTPLRRPQCTHKNCIKFACQKCVSNKPQRVHRPSSALFSKHLGNLLSLRCKLAINITIMRKCTRRGEPVYINLYLCRPRAICCFIVQSNLKIGRLISYAKYWVCSRVYLLSGSPSLLSVSHNQISGA